MLSAVKNAVNPKISKGVGLKFRVKEAGVAATEPKGNLTVRNAVQPRHRPKQRHLPNRQRHVTLMATVRQNVVNNTA